MWSALTAYPRLWLAASLRVALALVEYTSLPAPKSVSLRAVFPLFLVALIAPFAHGSAYDEAVLADHPVAYFAMTSATGKPNERDLTGRGHDGRYFPTGAPRKTKMPNGDWATVFDGFTQYLEVPSAPEFSIPPGGALTIEVWMRPDTLEFPSAQGGYVHWAGKGERGRHEYVLRMYSKTNEANRPNRISGYVYNPQGGAGSGCFFEDKVRAREWVHVAVVISMERAPGEVRIFKNGELRGANPLSQYNVVPRAGDAPLRIGTRDLVSFFKGAIGKFALYNRALSAADFETHIEKMQ